MKFENVSISKKNQHVVLDVELNVYSVSFSRIHAGKFRQRNVKNNRLLTIIVNVENVILSPA